jgi:hypothetical protein
VSNELPLTPWHISMSWLGMRYSLFKLCPLSLASSFFFAALPRERLELRARGMKVRAESF